MTCPCVSTENTPFILEQTDSFKWSFRPAIILLIVLPEVKSITMIVLRSWNEDDYRSSNHTWLICECTLWMLCFVLFWLHLKLSNCSVNIKHKTIGEMVLIRGCLYGVVEKYYMFNIILNQVLFSRIGLTKQGLLNLDCFQTSPHSLGIRFDRPLFNRWTCKLTDKRSEYTYISQLTSNYRVSSDGC